MGREGLPRWDDQYLPTTGFDSLHELMRAMILRSVEDLNCGGEIRQEALDYFNSEEEDYPLSFIFICRHFGFDPAKTKEAIVHSEHRISTRRRAA